MAIVGRAKYTRARAKFRGGAPFASRRVASRFRARACAYFARPTIAIAKIRDYSQSKKIQQYKTKESILRLKARWYNEGEKNSKYFCQLEKRHFQNKSISQLQKPDGSKLTSLRSSRFRFF